MAPTLPIVQPDLSLDTKERHYVQVVTIRASVGRGAKRMATPCKHGDGYDDRHAGTFDSRTAEFSQENRREHGRGGSGLLSL